MLERVYPDPDDVTGLVARPRLNESEIAWYPAEFVGFAKTEIRYGTGIQVGENIVNTVEVSAPGTFTTLTGL